MPIDWGSIPDWVAGVGAVTALVFARTAALSARRASDLQGAQVDELRAENRRRDDVERRVMASKVAVWVALGEDPGKAVVRFVNSGDLPIYGLTVYCFHPGGVIQRSYYVNGPDPARRTMRTMTARLAELFADTDPGVLLSAGRLTAACAFKDAGDVWWCRTSQGVLMEAAGPDDAAAQALASRPEGGADTVEILKGSTVQLER